MHNVLFVFLNTITIFYAGDLDEKFLNACRDGRLKDIKEAVEKGARLNSVNAQGNTALHLACWSGKLDVIKYLVSMYLKKDMPIDNKGYLGNTPLHRACLYTQLHIVQYLILIHLDRGIPIDTRNSEGNTCLHFAVRRPEQGAMVKFLLSSGFDWQIKNNKKQTALDIDKTTILNQFIIVASEDKLNLFHSIGDHEAAKLDFLCIWIRNTTISKKPILPAYKELLDVYSTDSDLFDKTMEMIFPDTNERKRIHYKIKNHYNFSNASQQKGFDIEFKYLCKKRTQDKKEVKNEN